MQATCVKCGVTADITTFGDYLIEKGAAQRCEFRKELQSRGGSARVSECPFLEKAVDYVYRQSHYAIATQRRLSSVPV